VWVVCSKGCAAAPVAAACVSGFSPCRFPACITHPASIFLAPGGAQEEDINAELGVGSVAADAELDAMKEEVGPPPTEHAVAL